MVGERNQGSYDRVGGVSREISVGINAERLQQQRHVGSQGKFDKNAGQGAVVASSISWLDASTEEQKRMREILGLFTDKESREELGLGQIRDALGDGLFPGTSTLHTRARYFLFIPWIFQQVSASRGTLENSRMQELALIKALSEVGGRNQGIIGYEAGSALKTVPSRVYWSALATYEILQDPGLSREQAVSTHGRHIPSELEELGNTTLRAWHANIPEPPEGFPANVPGGMELRYAEAQWLRERMIYSSPDSMLAHLLQHASVLDGDTPWDDLTVLVAEGRPRRILEHAQRFSEVIHGAQLLYNLLIARSYEDKGFIAVGNPSEQFEERLTQWGQEYWEKQPAVSWDLEDFFTTVAAIRGSRVASSSEAFVRQWTQMLNRKDPRVIATDTEAAALVADRERRNKGAMARIGNEKRLKTWGGSSGAGRYNYRWGYVRTILGDIFSALDRGPQPLGAEGITAEREAPSRA